MANLNKVMLIGNLTRDPELRFLPSGSQVCEFGLAVNRRWTDGQTGESKEQVCYVDLVVYGRQAETLHKYMKKGRSLFVEGRLDFQSWETPEGQKRSKLRVVVENFQFLGTGNREDGGDGGPAAGAPAMRSARPQPASSGSSRPANDVVMDDDDIPF